MVDLFTIKRHYALGKVSIDEYKRLYQIDLDRKLIGFEKLSNNDFYGHAFLLKNYSHISQKRVLKASIEHGIHNSLRTNVWKADYIHFPSNFTHSAHRTLKYNLLGRLSFPIGPYIFYASNLLSKDQFIQEKSRLGKSLLIFPDHSTHHSKTCFDNNSFIKKIEVLEKDFDTIRICIYWKDLLDSDFIDEYQKREWEIVTAGHMFDPLFVPRLRTIFELSDYVINSNFGTNLYYSVFLKKPTLIFYHNDDFAATSSVGKETIDSTDSIFVNISKYKETDNLKNLSSLLKYNYDIPQNEISLISYDAGFNYCRTKSEIKTMVDIAEDFYTLTNEGVISPKNNELIDYYSKFDEKKYKFLMSERNLNLGRKVSGGRTFFGISSLDIHNSLIIDFGTKSTNKYCCVVNGQEMKVDLQAYNLETFKTIRVAGSIDNIISILTKIDRLLQIGGMLEWQSSDSHSSLSDYMGKEFILEKNYCYQLFQKDGKKVVFVKNILDWNHKSTAKRSRLFFDISVYKYYFMLNEIIKLFKKILRKIKYLLKKYVVKGA